MKNLIVLLVLVVGCVANPSDDRWADVPLAASEVPGEEVVWLMAQCDGKPLSVTMHFDPEGTVELNRGQPNRTLWNHSQEGALLTLISPERQHKMTVERTSRNRATLSVLCADGKTVNKVFQLVRFQ